MSSQPGRRNETDKEKYIIFWKEVHILKSERCHLTLKKKHYNNKKNCLKMYLNDLTKQLLQYGK